MASDGVLQWERMGALSAKVLVAMMEATADLQAALLQSASLIVTLGGFRDPPSSWAPHKSDSIDTTTCKVQQHLSPLSGSETTAFPIVRKKHSPFVARLVGLPVKNGVAGL